MSKKTERPTWIRGHMWLPTDVHPLDIDWCDPLSRETEPKKEEEI